MPQEMCEDWPAAFGHAFGSFTVRPCCHSLREPFSLSSALDGISNDLDGGIPIGAVGIGVVAVCGIVYLFAGLLFG